MSLPFPGHAADRVVLQLEWLYQFEYAGFIAAKEKGFYADAGLDVEIREYKPGKDVFQQVSSGAADYAIHNSTLLFNQGKIAPLVLLGTYLHRSPLVLVTTPEIKKPHDLLGKKIMGTTNEFRYSSLALLLNHFEINADNTEFIEHSFSVDDFVSGKVDGMSAFLSNQIHELDLRGIDYRVMDPADYGFYSVAVNLYTSKDYALKHPERTQRFIEASNRGWQYALDHPDELVDIIFDQYSQRKSKEALRFEAEVTREMMMLDLMPIGAISDELSLRTFKQLKRSRLIAPDSQFEQTSLEQLFQKQSQQSFHLTKKETAYLERKQHLKVCIDPDWLPFEALKEGRHVGIAADVFEIFQQKLPVPLEILPARTWADSIAAAQKRQCDLFSLAAETPERLEYMQFTQPYIDFPVVLATDNSQIFVDDIRGVFDQPIGIVRGYAINELLRKRYPEANFVDVASISEGLERVESGDLYGYIDNLMPIAHIIQQQFTGNVKISGRLDQRISLAIGTRSDEPALHDIFQRLVVDLNQRPELKQSIYNSWVSVRQEVGFDYTLLWQILAVIAVFATFMLLHLLQLRRYNHRLRELSTTDPLTGLNNRHRMDELLHEQHQRMQRYGESCGIILLDVDYFKSVNDHYGHQVGDQVLKVFADIIRAKIRQSDHACRWGGEEFLIICPQTGLQGTQMLAEKLLQAIRDHSFPHNQPMTASLGVAEIAEKMSLHQQFELIDKALYRAKHEGRNRIETAVFPD